MPRDDYQGASGALNSLSTSFETITPSDGTNLAVIPRYVAVGATAGTVVCVDKDGNEITEHVEAGGLLKCRPTRIKATGTTATPIHGYY